MFEILMHYAVQGKNPLILLAIGVGSMIALKLHVSEVEAQKVAAELAKLKDDVATKALVDALQTSKEGLADAKAKFDADLNSVPPDTKSN